MGLKRADEIRTRMESIRSDMATLEKIDQEGEADEATHQRFDDLLAEADILNEELKPLAEREERIANVTRTAQTEANREDTTTDRSTPDLVTRTKRDPFADLDSVRTHMLPPSEVRSRAAAAIEQYANRQDHWALDHDAAEHATTLIYKRGKMFGAALAEQILVTGAPEYLAAFEQYLSDPGGFSTRAALSLTPANGGYLVPFTLDPTIILTNAGIVDPIRSIATTKQTATDTASYVTSAGATAGWTAESAEATDGNVGVGQITITPKRADSWIAGSYEVLADSGFAGELSKLLADAKARLEGAAFATGNTAATRPRGVVAVSAAVTTSIVASATTNAFVIADVYSVANALRPRDAAEAHWLGNKSIFNKIRQFDTSGSAAFWANLGMGRPQELLGQPVHEVSTMQSAVTTAGLVLLAGNFQQYYIVDRIGMTVQYNPMVMGRTNSRPTGEAGWLAMWRVGADTVDPDAFRCLQLNQVAANVPLA